MNKLLPKRRMYLVFYPTQKEQQHRRNKDLLKKLGNIQERHKNDTIIYINMSSRKRFNQEFTIIGHFGLNYEVSQILNENKTNITNKCTILTKHFPCIRFSRYGKHKHISIGDNFIIINRHWLSNIVTFRVIKHFWYTKVLIFFYGYLFIN